MTPCHASSSAALSPLWACRIYTYGWNSGTGCTGRDGSRCHCALASATWLPARPPRLHTPHGRLPIRPAACAVHSAQVPQLLPGSRGTVPLAPRITREDERVIANVAIISNFLAGALLLRSPVCHLAHCTGCRTTNGTSRGLAAYAASHCRVKSLHTSLRLVKPSGCARRDGQPGGG